MIRALHCMMDLLDALPDQKQAAREHHKVLARERKAKNDEEWCRQFREQKDEAQQEDARHERQHQPESPRLALLLGGQFAGEDGNEDDVVHAEDNLEDGER